MATTHILELFHLLLQQAMRKAPGSVDVVSVVATEFATDLPLMEQIARHAGAPVLIANGITGAAVDGVEPVPEFAALRELIETLELPPLQLTVVNVDSDRVAVRVDGEPTPTNPGRRNLLGALTALLDANLPGQPLAVIAYDETNIESAARRALWSLFNQTLPAMGLALPRTLLLLIGDEAIDSHYLGPGSSLRYIIRPNALVRRHAWEVNRREIAELAEGETPLVLFLGAGSSYSSNLPLGDTLRNQTLRRFLHDQEGASIQELMTRFYQWVVDQDRLLSTEQDEDERTFYENLTLERVLREEDYILPGEGVPQTLHDFAIIEAEALQRPGQGILALRDVLGVRKRLVIVMVNFDRLVEDAADAAKVKVYTTDEEFSAAPEHISRYLEAGEGPVPILKLHGSIERPATIVANVERTALGLSSARSAALTLLANTTAPTDWVYIGYSMRDPDVIAELRLPRFGTGTQERWVAPVTDPTVEKLVRVARLPFWSDRDTIRTLHERSISETADTFYTELRSRVLGWQSTKR